MKDTLDEDKPLNKGQSLYIHSIQRTKGWIPSVFIISEVHNSICGSTVMNIVHLY